MDDDDGGGDEADDEVIFLRYKEWGNGFSPGPALFPKLDGIYKKFHFLLCSLWHAIWSE